jgi:ATP-dependent Clp protease protease subunit
MNTLNYSAFNNLEKRADSRDRTVESIDNHIYFYADVDSDCAFDLLRELREIDATLRKKYTTRDLEDLDFPLVPIWLHIHSFGGSLFSGFAVADQIRLIKSPVYSVIEGVCASAATLIALACDKRYILPNSFMLIHQLSGLMWGTHEQFKDELRLQEMAMERLIAYYTAYTPNSADALREMLTRDTWMDAPTCVERGFAETILEPPIQR